jgi:ubiquinone/menaquinone biosynthesis C-methylase UbiE
MYDKKELETFKYKTLVPLVDSFLSISGKNILDFGCGSGHSTFALAWRGASCKGIDISKESVEKAIALKKEYFNDLDINFISVKDTINLPFSDNEFDVVVCNAVFEHIFPEKREKIFNELYRVTKPNGFIIIRGTPNRYFPKDGHTTELWLVPWMPLALAKYFVIAINGGIKKTDKIAKLNIEISKKIKMIPKNEWYSRGIVGLGFGDVQKWIKNNSLGLKIENDNNKLELDRYFFSSTSHGKNKVLKFTSYSMNIFLKLFSISAHYFIPYLNLVCKKVNK